MFKKRIPEDQDPHSIGNLLIEGRHCTPEQIREAIEYQKEHRDVLMGVYLVRAGMISDDILSAMILKQEAAKRQKGAVIKFAKYAARKAREVNAHLDRQLPLAEELK